MGQNTPDLARLDRIREMGRTMTKGEIAQELGITRQRVNQIVSKHGIETAQARATVNKAEAIRRIEAECQGMTRHQIAAHLGIPYYCAVEYARDADVEVAANQHRPPKSDLTLKVLAEAPGLAASGVTIAEAARQLGIGAPQLHIKLKKYLPDLKWRDGRRKVA